MRTSQPQDQLRTVVAFVLDESGSMYDTAEDTRGAVNQYFETLAKETPDASVSLMKFSDQGNANFRVISQAVQPLDVPKMTEKTYVPNGNTPLFDAIGKAITETAQVEADRYVVVILSDGAENSSREWTQASVRELIQAKEAQDNWTIVYLGANQDAFLTGQMIGTSVGNTMSYAQTSGGVAATMDSLSGATVTALRSASGSTQSFFKDAGQTAANYVDPKIWVPNPSDEPDSDEAEDKKK